MPDPTAHLAAELGVLAFKRGYAAVVRGATAPRRTAAPYALAALDELRARHARRWARPVDDADADTLFAMHSSARVLRYWDAPPWHGACSRSAIHRDVPDAGR